MRSPWRGSSPFVAETRVARSGTRSPTAASTASTKCEGTAISTVARSARAWVASAVTWIEAGSVSPGR